MMIILLKQRTSKRCLHRLCRSRAQTLACTNPEVMGLNHTYSWLSFVDSGESLLFKFAKVLLSCKFAVLSYYAQLPLFFCQFI